MHSLLGARCKPIGKRILLKQRPFTETLMAYARLANAIPRPTLLPPSHSLYEKEAPLTDVNRDEMRHVPYRSVRNMLLYTGRR